MSAAAEVALPRLADLGADLLQVSRLRRAATLLRPIALGALYTGLAVRGRWVPAVVVLVVLFDVLVAVVHDLLHSSLGLSTRANDRWLSVMGVLALQSGHALQSTHLAHHHRFPRDDDPEAYVAEMSLGRAVLEGPVYAYRLWQWARQRSAHLRTRAGREALGHAALGIGSVALLPWTRVPFAYAATMFVACSLFPAVSVNLFHRRGGDGPLGWTRTVRGAVLPLITLGSAYHLEHHLYPKVPSPNYRRLARRLRPALDGAGVEGYRLR